MQYKKIPWSNNWWIENDKAWFCSGETSTILCADMKSGECKFVAQIPENDKTLLSKYPYCVKYKDCIFCLPHCGKSVWCYDIVGDGWEKIEIANESYLTFFSMSYEQDAGSVWLLEEQTGKMFEVNLEKKALEISFYTPRESGGEYVLVQDKLYCTHGYEIYCIDVSDGGFERYQISGVKDEIYTICFDGTNFWLGGCYKEIYVWNEKEGIVKTITKFPEQFGFYYFETREKPYLDCDSVFNPKYTLFSPSLVLGKYVWFITCRSDGIIYVDKNSYQVFYLKVEEEEETQESIENNFLGYKFQLEYVRENRYIGVYSAKNRWIFEIDTENLCVRKQDYRLDSQTILYMMKAAGYTNSQYIFKENKEKDNIIFTTMVQISKEEGKRPPQIVGEQIYKMLNIANKYEYTASSGK